MSPIEVIRKQLDERGIEWWTVESLDKVPLTVCVIDGVRYKFRPQGRDIIVSSCTEGTVTAEQAIAMTVGVGTCRAVVCNQSDCVHNREYRCACTDLEIQDQECMTYRCRDIDYDEEEE